MCLAVPGKILTILVDPHFGLRRGKVDFGGIRKEVSLDYTPDACVGDYVMVHVGFALSVVDEAEANYVFDALKEMDLLEELEVIAT
ncbi:hydrogenase expression/formation protein HypC [Granulicella pectinivorans]|jgi:hydrogenase expression/formation protein HypC|uniref:Hydrogenase expression/formation protein HypC n=1 Tax=Granulicella pectinivorans TaxID=474950 RepID=A0A1I6MR50_9BACT|nr:HypC/HybG/HupF family hydrogenase formation chaperone [Granulicella pectinivorans]SFS18185.1 hydrogenase expression/formation protein HypC [Granulicella pectinivorans]